MERLSKTNIESGYIFKWNIRIFDDDDDDDDVCVPCISMKREVCAGKYMYCIPSAHPTPEYG